MPTNLSEIKQLFTDWVLLAEDNILFVIALVIITWLLVAILYSFKTLLLKNKHKAESIVFAEVQTKLSAAEQRNQQYQDQIKADSTQQKNDKQQLGELEEKVQGRNQAIVEKLRSIASQFEFSEQLVGSDHEMKDEFIWQQQDNIVQQLTDRLGVAQQEKETLQVAHQRENAKLNEQNSLVTNLQSSLDTQAKQFVQLEQLLETQQQSQRQQHLDIQQQLETALLKQKDETPKMSGVAIQPQSTVETQQEKNISAPIDPKEEALVTSQIVDFSNVDKVSAERTAETLETIASEVELENLHQAPSAVQVESATADSELQDHDVQDLLNLAEPAFNTSVENESQPSTHVSESSEESASASRKGTGKFKSFLGKVKKTVSSKESTEKIETLTTDDLQISEPGETKEKVGRLKSLLAKAKKTEEVLAEPEQKVAPLPSEDSIEVDVPGVPEVQIEQQIESFSVEELQTSDADSEHIEPDYGKSNFKVPGVLNKLLGKLKK